MATSSRPGPPQVPPEIRDIVIDFLHDDLPALSATARTSRTLRPASQFHLFHSVTINSKETLRKFTAALDTTPVFARFVHKLTIVETEDWVDDYLMSELTHALPYLETLELRTIAWDLLGPQTAEFIQTFFPTVRALELYDCVFGDFTGLRELICAFPRLTSFSASFCHWREEADVSARTSVAGVPELSEVHLVGCPQGPVAQWLLQMPHALRSIVSRDTKDKSLRSVSELIQAAGEALEDLWFSAQYYWDHQRRPIVMPASLNLIHNTNLRSLRLDVPFLSRDSQWITDLVSTIRWAPLQTVKLDLWLESLKDVAQFDWDTFGKAISPSRLGHLRSVEFLVTNGSIDEPALKAEIERRLPELAERGMITVRA